jgi:hypothetical protein
MKKNISIILSILALAIASVLAVLLACRNVTLSSISLDTFVGVMVAMIGILVTFAVGWQIINALEIKGKLAEIEKLKADINDQREQMHELAESTKHDSMLVRAQAFYRDGDFINATICSMDSLSHCLPLKVPSNIHLVLHTTEAFMMGINKFATVEEKNEILRLDEAIRSADNYILISENYEHIWRKFIGEKGFYLRDRKEV